MATVIMLITKRTLGTKLFRKNAFLKHIWRKLLYREPFIRYHVIFLSDSWTEINKETETNTIYYKQTCANFQFLE